jgi:hypothetical protein
MTTNGSLGAAAEAKKEKTQSLFREVNGRINDVRAQRGSVDMPQDVICECAQPTCSERITITALEYRGLRSRSTWFVIAPLRSISSPRSNASSRTTATGGSSKSTGKPEPPAPTQARPTRRRAPTGPAANDRDARALRPARDTCPRARPAQAERRSPPGGRAGGECSAAGGRGFLHDPLPSITRRSTDFVDSTPGLPGISTQRSRIAAMV